MTDLVVSIVLIVVALTFVVKTVFYIIEVLVGAKASRKTLKLANKCLKKYEALFDKMFDSDIFDN